MSSRPAETEGVPAHELALWTRRFAAMVDAGVSLMRCLATLAEEETTPSMRDVTRDLMAKVEAGETLTQAMSRWPEVFSRHYVGLVIFGEVGGILQIGLNRLAERTESGLLIPGWEEERPLTRADLAEWCWQFAHMLQAGVPLLYALETLARVSRPPLDGISSEMRDELAAGGSLVPEREGEEPAMWRYPGIFGPTVRTLLGPVPQALLQVADLLDVEARLERKGELAPLATAPRAARPASPEDQREEHPVVRQVNEVLKAAIQAGAQGIEFEPAGEGKGTATLARDAEVLSTTALESYHQALRRVKVMADIDPFTTAELRSQIHLGYQNRVYLFSVHSRAGGERLSLYLREDEKAVQL